MTIDESLLLVEKDLPDQGSMDFALLRSEGLKHIERLAGELWTDYNPHDPGITILEQLSYAITDLGYRCEHSIPDLLAEDGEDAYKNLFGPKDLLPSPPVTLLDMRKLLIDIDGVRNAWVESLDETPNAYSSFINAERTFYHIDVADRDARNESPLYLKGLYRVFIEREPLSSTTSEQIKNEAYVRLHNNRKLCEDYVSVQILKPQAIAIEATIHIDTLATPEQSLADIFNALERYFSPKVNIYSLSERLKQGMAIDDILDGPLLEHGFIDDDELAEFDRLTEVRLSDLIHQVMQVEGVNNIEHMAFRKDVNSQQYLDKWLVDIDSNSSPLLDRNNSKFILIKDNFSVQYDGTTSDEMFQYKQYQEHQTSASKGDLSLLKVQKGKNQNVANYLSIQHHFPDIYGVNVNGLPKDASDARKGQTKQLQAYLLFFDQLLANYFSQLAHVKDLFSFHKDTSDQDSLIRTYFSQLVEDEHLNFEPLHVLEEGESRARSSKLQSITEDPYESAYNELSERKERFLNHLLARFATQFTDYSLILFESGSTVSSAKNIQTRIHDKQHFLQNFPRLSARRGLGFNYLKEIESENRSGLEDIVRNKLNIQAGSDEDFILVEHILLRPIIEDQVQIDPILSNSPYQDPYSMQFTVGLPAFAPRFLDSDNSQIKQAFIEQQIREETPAHIMIHFLWIETETDMASLRKTLSDWLAQKRTFTLNSLGASGASFQSGE